MSRGATRMVRACKTCRHLTTRLTCINRDSEYYQKIMRSRDGCVEWKGMRPKIKEEAGS